ncbi:2-iminoacetate synthase ThiH (plasmid) [Candidatus Pantoea edessiphila]|uniref:2-iminoacetate synthase ThiH n=1 Tax=Candidatus Pantoea edessiphila TaxID=2044610 RepID=A0A2P5SXC3_9GAMM|nr:2-iminoacetate synthase ThiH [Candidatus Pantoea edessiphila]MBK4775895.1 2-iminoacetate synthase ThiH [Pantoea sp. Edef]PPI86952.1 2-iminoacetate synthase ThiH [Candidatus Pantoea edessiphila]
MESFANHWNKIHWHNLDYHINSQNEQDVKIALKSKKINLQEMSALLSPAAKNHIELLANKAKQLTRKRFGNVVNFYLPLYLSNVCSNECTYCGFSVSNRIKRKILNKKEIIRECEAIRNKGISHLLLVTGEHTKKVGIEYFRRYLPLIRKYCSLLLMEVQPMSQEEYVELKNIGLDGVLVYQETYDVISYKNNHLRGKKRDFFWRLETPERLARAGISKIGLGILIGLSNNWRVDCYMAAQHLLYLRNVYWKSDYSISFPRLRPCIGNNLLYSCNNMDDIDLLQVMCAFRLFMPEIEISLSTRESPNFRDHVTPIVVNNISAGSKTNPGGYTSDKKELEQFTISDDRSPQEMYQVLLESGLQPIWKDWDIYLGRDINIK